MSLKEKFPIFRYYPNLVYLDSAATTQKPEQVIAAVDSCYRQAYANPHRGLYELGRKSTQNYEDARKKVQEFLKADSSREIIFTKSATEALNLLSFSIGKTLLEGDQIILSIAEHHSNLVPWQLLAQAKGLDLQFLKLTPEGDFDWDHFRSLVNERTKVASLTSCSNVLGRIQSMHQAKSILTEQGSNALLITDGTQLAPHHPIDVREMGADFLVLSSHKLYGPAGIGVLWGKEALLEQLHPYQTGGGMIRTVTLTESTWNDLPWKWEAGTPNLEGAIGFAAALDFIQEIGWPAVQSRISELNKYANTALTQIEELRLLAEPSPESGIFSFALNDIHPHDLADFLGQDSICLRAGHHCAAPLHESLNLNASNRASLALYNEKEDLDRLVAAIKSILSNYRHV